MAEIRINETGTLKLFDADDSHSASIKAGTISADVASITLESGETVFNEDSADIDFRVESNGNANMIFVDGGNDHVNIGTSTDLGGVLNVSGIGVFQTADNTNTLSLVCTDEDATSGPRLSMRRESASPADSDNLGQIYFTGKDSAGNNTDYVTIKVATGDVTDGTEDAQIEFDVVTGGTAREYLRLASGSEPSVVINEDSQDIDFRVESDGVTHMLFVNGGGNTVGVGTTGDILGRLHVMNGDSGADADGAGDELVLEHDSHCGMTILSPNNLEGGIKFGDPQDNDAGRIQYDHANDAMFFMTSGSLHFNIASNGDLTATDTSIGSISDQRLKKDIVDFTYDINKFKQLKPRSFEWKNKSEHGDKTGLRGFIAQEVDSVDNHFVNSYSIKESYQPLDFALLDDSGTFTETKEYSISEELKNQIPDGKKVGDKYEVTSNKPRTTYDSKLGDKDAMYISIIQQLITRIEALEDA